MPYRDFYKKLSDEELIERYVNQRDQKAFAFLQERYNNVVMSSIAMVVKGKDWEVIQDLSQETWIKIYKGLESPRYKERGKFSAWIKRIAKNTAIDYFRKKQNDPQIRESELNWPVEQLMYPEVNTSLALTKEEKQFLHELINRLSDNQRQVLIMRIFNELKYQEIAQLTEVSINTTLGRMRYALINIRQMMSKEKIGRKLMQKFQKKKRRKKILP